MLLFTIWYCTESGESDTSDSISFKNKTFNDESTPLATPGFTTHKEKADFHSAGGGEPALYTDQMISGNSALLKATDL